MFIGTVSTALSSNAIRTYWLAIEDSVIRTSPMKAGPHLSAIIGGGSIPRVNKISNMRTGRCAGLALLLVSATQIFRQPHGSLDQQPARNAAYKVR